MSVKLLIRDSMFQYICKYRDSVLAFWAALHLCYRLLSMVYIAIKPCSSMDQGFEMKAFCSIGGNVTIHKWGSLPAAQPPRQWVLNINELSNACVTCHYWSMHSREPVHQAHHFFSSQLRPRSGQSISSVQSNTSYHSSLPITKSRENCRCRAEP